MLTHTPFWTLRPLALAAMVATSSGMQAWAQAPQADSANPPAPTHDADRVEPKALGDMTVSGTRESASTRLALTPKETPQSTSSVPRSQMDQQSLASVDAVLRKVTGVFVTMWDTQRPAYYARGFQITDFQVDGIPTYSNATNQEYDTALYERVEIVRGANGILTGVGVPSATVNMVRKRPQKEFSASVALTAGSWNLYRGELDVNAPLAQDGSVRGRLVLAPQNKQSFRNRYAEDKAALMAVIEADMGTNTVVSAGLQRQSNTPTAPIWGTIPRFASDGAPIDLPLSTSFSPTWTRWERTSTTAFANVEHQINNDWLLRATLSHTEGDNFRLATYGYGATTSQAPFPNRSTGAGVRLYAGISGGSDIQDQFDGYLSGKFELGGRKHDVVVGLSSSRTNARTDVYGSLAGWSHTIPNVYTWDGSAPAPTYSKTGAWRDQTTRQTGLYASARWRISEPLSVLTGVRITDWHRQVDSFSTAGAFTATSAVQNEKRKLTPYAGVVYDITPTLAAYASYTSIFNPQNYRDRDNNPLAPAVGSNAEVGLKTELLDRRVQASAALFQTRQNNYGVVDSSRPQGSLPDGATPYVAVNGTRSHGFELDVSGQILRQWRINAGLTKATITRNTSDLIYANLPEYLLRLGTDYQFSGTLAPLTLGGDLQWQSKLVGYNYPHPTRGKVTVTEAPVTLLNLRATWQFTPKVSATVAVNNLTNRKYWTNLDYGNYGDPRNVSMTLRASY